MKLLKRIINAVCRLMCRKRTGIHENGFCGLVRDASVNMACMPADLGAIGVVFSMDRALQLHALLGTYRDNVRCAPKLTIIYRTTSERHEKAYADVFSEYDELIGRVVRQEDRKSFRRIVIDAMSAEAVEHIFFLVDDNMFIDPVDIGAFSRLASSFAIPTLRLGDNLRKSYTVQKRQNKPTLEDYPGGFKGVDGSNELRSWCWGAGELDWGYPLSVDGHIFQRRELLAMAEAVEFDSPNTFECALQKFNLAFQWRLGICYKKSKLINIPYNRVQSDFENIHGEIHQDEMLKMWEGGFRIDRVSYYGFVNESAHQELPLRLMKVGSK